MIRYHKSDFDEQQAQSKGQTDPYRIYSRLPVTFHTIYDKTSIVLQIKGPYEVFVSLPHRSWLACLVDCLHLPWEEHSSS